MSKTLKGTKTERNLLTAFAGESQARNRYTYFASASMKEGYVQISKAFEETAAQEKEHAERLFKFLEGGSAHVSWDFPAGKIGTTLDNLKAAAAGEDEEWEKMYPLFAKEARGEGFEEIASCMDNIAIAEKGHSHRYKSFAANIEDKTVFKKPVETEWRCINCGYIHKGLEAPEKCPACAHAKAYFEVYAENW
jgi:rubrerythrin